MAPKSDIRYDADALSRAWHRGAHHAECNFCALTGPLRYVDVPQSTPDDTRAGWMCLGCFVDRQAFDLIPAAASKAVGS